MITVLTHALGPQVVVPKPVDYGSSTPGCDSFVSPDNGADFH